MYKQDLLNNIEKEINICCRLYTKILPAQLHYKPKEGVRSILELLQYLTVIGPIMPKYWLMEDDTDFNSFFGSEVMTAQEMPHDYFLTAMDNQKTTIKGLFDQIDDKDLLQKEITYPWGGKASLGEGIIATSIKWLSAYKLQLFLFMKLSDDRKLTTADAWALTDLSL